MLENWITIQEAEKISGYNSEYLRRLIRNGKIIARKISIVWVVEHRSLMAYLAKNQVPGDKRRGPRPSKKG